MNEIDVLIKWRIVHGYYTGGLCRGIEIVPDFRTQNLLKRRGAMFRKLAANEWGLLGTKGVEWDEEDELVLERNITDAAFLYVTENPEDFKKVVLPLSAVKPGEERVLEFRAKELKWEYIFIPRERSAEGQIELVDMSGSLHFSEMEKVDEAGKQAWRTVTLERVKLQEKYEYQLRLIERKVLGNRILNKNVISPRPGRFIYAAEGCIRQMVFF